MQDPPDNQRQCAQQQGGFDQPFQAGWIIIGTPPIQQHQRHYTGAQQQQGDKESQGDSVLPAGLRAYRIFFQLRAHVINT